MESKLTSRWCRRPRAQSAALRHGEDDEYVQWAGHIGYGIRPSARRRGLATFATLALSLLVLMETGSPIYAGVLGTLTHVTRLVLRLGAVQETYELLADALREPVSS